MYRISDAAFCEKRKNDWISFQYYKRGIKIPAVDAEYLEMNYSMQQLLRMLNAHISTANRGWNEIFLFLIWILMVFYDSFVHLLLIFNSMSVVFFWNIIRGCWLENVPKLEFWLNLNWTNFAVEIPYIFNIVVLVSLILWKRFCMDECKLAWISCCCNLRGKKWPFSCYSWKPHDG